MFPNCIDRLGHQKRETKQQQTKQRKNKEKINKLKMGIIAPTMNHYPRNR